MPKIYPQTNQHKTPINQTLRTNTMTIIIIIFMDTKNKDTLTDRKIETHEWLNLGY